MVTMEVFSRDDVENPEVMRFESFRDAANEALSTLAVEIANAINDAVADGGEEMQSRVGELTTILTKLCSPDRLIVVDAIDTWAALVENEGVGETFVSIK